MGGTPENLAAMNLKIKDVNDECLGYASWTRKRAVHTLAKANAHQTNKPLDDGDWWGFDPPTAANSCQAPRCNLAVAVARISANIPAVGQVAAVPVPEVAYVITEEMGTWNMDQMLFTKAIENSYKHLDIVCLDGGKSLRHRGGLGFLEPSHSRKINFLSI